MMKPTELLSARESIEQNRCGNTSEQPGALTNVTSSDSVTSTRTLVAVLPARLKTPAPYVNVSPARTLPTLGVSSSAKSTPTPTTILASLWLLPGFVSGVSLAMSNDAGRYPALGDATAIRHVVD